MASMGRRANSLAGGALPRRTERGQATSCPAATGSGETLKSAGCLRGREPSANTAVRQEPGRQQPVPVVSTHQREAREGRRGPGAMKAVRRSSGAGRFRQRAFLPQTGRRRKRGSRGYVDLASTVVVIAPWPVRLRTVRDKEGWASLVAWQRTRRHPATTASARSGVCLEEPLIRAHDQSRASSNRAIRPAVVLAAMRPDFVRRPSVPTAT